MDRLSKNEFIAMIDSLHPKIKKSLQNTNVQEREDLVQEMMLKILESYERITELEAPNFEEFLNEYINTKRRP